jgi:hypothetical protein
MDFKLTPIDRFSDVVDWMNDVNGRLDRLESELRRVQETNKYHQEEISNLNDFAHGVRLVTKHTEQVG